MQRNERDIPGGGWGLALVSLHFKATIRIRLVTFRKVPRVINPDVHKRVRVVQGLRDKIAADHFGDDRGYNRGATRRHQAKQLLRRRLANKAARKARRVQRSRR